MAEPFKFLSKAEFSTLGPEEKAAYLTEAVKQLCKMTETLQKDIDGRPAEE
ncbi:MAG TPA: hypothetical protein VM183_12765 [Burkholderiales bacterium]|nr:hypothetical protein [Burkholderiales bacterium]